MKARAVEVRRKKAGAGGVGGALMALWRDVSSAAILPLNATDTAWRVRDAIPAILVRDLASCRDHASKLEAARADGLLADEIDNGGLDASDLDAGDDGDAVAILLSAGTLPPNLRRLTERIHTKARKEGPDPRAVQFVLRWPARAPSMPPTKKRGRDDDDEDERLRWRRPAQWREEGREARGGLNKMVASGQSAQAVESPQIPRRTGALVWVRRRRLDHRGHRSCGRRNQRRVLAPPLCRSAKT